MNEVFIGSCRPQRDELSRQLPLTSARQATICWKLFWSLFIGLRWVLFVCQKNNGHNFFCEMKRKHSYRSKINLIPLEWTIVDILHTTYLPFVHVIKHGLSYYTDHLPTSSCPHSYWMPQNNNFKKEFLLPLKKSNKPIDMWRVYVKNPVTYFVTD